MGANTTSQGVRDLMTLSYTLFHDLPLATARWRLGQGSEKATTEAAWKVYDASVRVSATAVDTLYRTPLFSETVSNAANYWLRWRHMGNAVNRVLVNSFWQMLGLPTAAEIETLTAHVRALEARVSKSTQHWPHHASPRQRRPLDPFVEGVACSEFRKERSQEARTAA